MMNLSIRAKLILLVLTLTIALTAVLSITAYENEKETVVTAIDDKLSIGANEIVMLIPDAYHAKIDGPASVSPAEYKAISDQLTERARRMRFQYLYTYMMVGDQIVTTSTSANLTDNSVVPFLSPYQQPSPNLLRAFRERQAFFDEYEDEFGQFRSAFVPVVTSNGKVFVAGADVPLQEVNDQRNAHLRDTALIAAGVSIVFVLASVFAAARISRPIVEISNVTQALGESSFTLGEAERRWLQNAGRGRDEAGRLANAFIHLDKTLQEYIVNLKETTAAKERVESELNVAKNIQNAFLHRIFPAFPGRRDFDLYAALEPAKEVGGDLYDFQVVGDELYFTVGDVSDKGVPAALLMVVTQTLMRFVTQNSAGDPAEMLMRVNLDVLDKNEEFMFVTVFFAALNLKTGELRYTNAGHNPPLIRRASGESEWLPMPSGLVLGVMADIKYETMTATLRPGDTLLAYTDGVTEAKAPDSSLYSEERLIDIVNTNGSAVPSDLVRVVFKSVKLHASTAPQSDDITVLAVTFRPDEAPAAAAGN